MNSDEAYRQLTGRLGSESEAHWLVEEVSGWRPGQVAADLSHDDETALEALVKRRLDGEPLQYVLGQWSFRTLELDVDPRALIPRPETEVVVGVALEELAWIAGEKSGPIVVDLGTGTGAIALSIASEAWRDYPDLKVIAVDDDPEALELAGENLELLSRRDPEAGSRIELRPGYWWEGLDRFLRRRVDLAVSNPPYVSESEWEHLGADVRREPRHALVAPDDEEGNPGLACVRAVLEGALSWLARPGTIVVELSPDQAETAMALAETLGFDDIRIEQDLAQRDRMVVAKLT